MIQEFPGNWEFPGNLEFLFNRITGRPPRVQPP
jgi:hypothetical protein